MTRAACSAVVAVVALFVSNFSSAAESSPPQIKTKIETVGLFKNGLAVVRRTAHLDLNAGNTFDITDLPEPVHGTFWIESAREVSVTVTSADVAMDEDLNSALPAMDNVSLAGATVTVYFRSEHLPTVTGTVKSPPDPQRAWDRNYGWSRPRGNYWWADSSTASHYVPQPQSQQLVIKTDQGDVVIAPDTVAYLRVDQPAERPTARRPVLRMHVPGGPNKSGADVAILYLTKGASWAPNYTVDISDSSQLAFQQSAVIRNEIEDWNDAEILLISGFPNIEFGHVLSPMSPATDLSTFFRALGTESRLSHSSRGDVMSQTVASNFVASGVDMAGAQVQNPQLEGVDMHYHSIGRHTLRAGESLFINMASETTPFERIVQWVVPDDRDAWGNRRDRSYDYGYYNLDSQADREQPWDALRFRNPLDRPMTTAPAMVVSDNMVRGQSMVTWAGPEEMVVLPVNKTLSVRAQVSEVEDEKARESLERYGRNYWRTSVTGTLQVVNQRKETVTMVTRVEFSGDLIEAQGDPKATLRSEGVWSVNPRRQLEWTIELKPGESRELTYRYRVLAPR